MARTKTADRDMTQGGIFRALLLFSLPLLAGNFFQQCYNTVDSIVLGNFVGKAALAAVGTTTPIINTLIGLFLGLSAGIGVVISQFYGAKEEEKVGQAVQTSLLLVLLLCGVFTAVGIAMVPGMLRLMATPADVFPQAARYLRIYFAGVSGLMLYNLGAGILRAVGDARRPLYFLLFSAGVNTGLDLLFVAVFHWGIAGAAIATVAAQVLSAGLVLGVLTRSRGCYRIQWRGMRMHRGILRNIFVVGVPSALQLAITSFSNVFVQSYVNRFASSCMAGWAAYQKIDAFVILPMTTLSVTATTFVGQNVGAGNWDRAKQGIRCALGGDGGPFGPADGLCPAPVHPVQPGAGGAGVRGVFYPPDLPLLSGGQLQSDLRRGPAGGGGRQGAHGDHAGVLCGLPAALSLCHLPGGRDPAAGGPGLSGGLGGVQRGAPVVLPQRTMDGPQPGDTGGAWDRPGKRVGKEPRK